ncbi:NAD(P)H-dependent oxidoreductase [Thalassomonas viridans]|uniref:FMN dependent NADH:quinone oxidoreductase n=1 Tax=Thalassomonas viridans TaxID=137584 RepID=A0AAE9Z689_9GAMM|nr:NAD(P)H-dependent oxidoreductase [Thalassomonas viridans]WDE05867.1 NAD(P)H-dependent oxidoreductase [Thalassomonas viridans]
MKNVLVINSSPNTGYSLSTQLTSMFAGQLEQGFNLVVRDLGVNPPKHLDQLALSGFFTAPEQHSEEQKSALMQSNELIAELKAADIIIIGSAMHNHSITSGLKAYFDQVARAGITFQYGANGPEGLLTGKQAYVITTAGGDYSLDFMKAMDFQTPYLRHILGFIGITEVEFIPAQGGAMGPEVAEKNQAAARERIKAIAAELSESVAA